MKLTSSITSFIHYVTYRWKALYSCPLGVGFLFHIPAYFYCFPETICQFVAQHRERSLSNSLHYYLRIDFQDLMFLKIFTLLIGIPCWEARPAKPVCLEQWKFIFSGCLHSLYHLSYTSAYLIQIVDWEVMIAFPGKPCNALIICKGISQKA